MNACIRHIKRVSYGLIACLVVLGGSSLWAQRCDVCIGIDALYWKPYNNLFVGNLSCSQGASVTTEQLFLSSDFEWGFRVHGCANLSCYGLWADFLYVGGDNSFKLTETNLNADFSSPFVSFSGTDLDVRIDEHFKYFAADFLASRNICCRTSYSFCILGGVRWLRFQREAELFGKQLSSPFVANDNRVSQHFAGIGPAFGIAGRCFICKGFSIYLKGIVSAQIGRDRSGLNARVFVLPEGMPAVGSDDFGTQSLTVLVPVFDGRLGLSYCFSLCGLPLSLRAAYEYRTHFDMLQTGSPLDATVDLRRSVSLGGLIFGGSIGF